MRRQPSMGVVAIIALIVVATVWFFLCKAYSIFWQTEGSEMSVSTIQPMLIQPSSERMMKTQEIESPAISELGVPNAQESADWKVYQNKELQFEVQYPGNWLPSIWVTDDASLSLLSPERYNEELRLDNSELMHVVPDISLSVIDRTQAEYIISQNQYNKKYVSESIMLGGKTAVRYQISDPDGAKDEIYLYTGQRVIVFSRTGASEKIFNDIISTLKFY